MILQLQSNMASLTENNTENGPVENGPAENDLDAQPEHLTGYAVDSASTLQVSSDKTHGLVYRNLAKRI